MITAARSNQPTKPPVTQGLFFNASLIHGFLHDESCKKEAVSLFEDVSKRNVAVVFLSPVEDCSKLINTIEQINFPFRKKVLHTFTPVTGQSGLGTREIKYILEENPSLLVNESMMLTNSLADIVAAKKMGMPYYFIPREGEERPRSLSANDSISIKELRELVTCL